MASLAQQESASLSQNVKLGLQFRYQEGKVQVNHEHFLGYTKDEEGNLIIDEEEAKTIRRFTESTWKVQASETLRMDWNGTKSRPEANDINGI